MLVVVIGAGAAGLVAATEAARRGAHVILLEKSNKTGVKILMSGGTRCNLTHDTNARGITEVFGHARRFLQPAVGAFPPASVIQMFNEAGVPTKVEATGKVFPTSDRALHVRDALRHLATAAGAEIRTGCGVTKIAPIRDQWEVEAGPDKLIADRVIVTAGGKSYPGCGTTGDAYDWLSALGHRIETPRPALVPLVGGHSWTHSLSGLTLADCEATVQRRDGDHWETAAQRRASFLFTHFGFSGPAAMDVSGAITAADSLSDVSLRVDLLPSLNENEIRAELGDRSGDGGRQRVTSVVAKYLPSRLASVLVEQAAGGGDGQAITVAQLPRDVLNRLAELMKRMPLPVAGTRGFAKAEVTAGGVSLSEVDSKTMASKLVAGLFIAGEVLDVDGPIGGYNFQAAFSTGRAAGIAAAAES